MSYEIYIFFFLNHRNAVFKTVDINAGETSVTVKIQPANMITILSGTAGTSLTLKAAYLTPVAGGGVSCEHNF